MRKKFPVTSSKEENVQVTKTSEVCVDKNAANTV